MSHDKRILPLFGGILTIALFALVGCGGAGGGPVDDIKLLPAPKTMQLTSASFLDGEIIPREYSCDAQSEEYGVKTGTDAEGGIGFSIDVTPQLAWNGVPPEAKSVALIFNDPATPAGNWVHWTLYGIPPNITELEAGTLPDNTDPAPAGARHGKNSFDLIGYDGPCPYDLLPHDYFFTVYALDTEIDLDEGASLSQLTSAMSGHILAEGHLMGVYAHDRRPGKRK